MLVLAQVVDFPRPSAFGLTMLMLAFAGMLGVAVFLEGRRRRDVKRMTVANQWRFAEQVLQERQLSAEETSTLRDLIGKYAPREPLAVVTTRAGFGRMVEAAMTAIRRKKDEEAFHSLGIQLRDIRIQLGLEITPLGQLIRSTREIEPGQWLEVAKVPSAGEPEWAKLMVEVVDEAYLYLVRKSDAALPALPSTGEPIRCHLWRDEDARYLFTTTVVAVDQTPPTWILEHTGTLNRTQAREHFRVRHEQSTTIGILSAKLSDESGSLALQPPVTRIRGRVTSLSAGGCALVCPQAVSNRMLLRIRIEIPGGKPIDAHAQIISSSAISGGRYLIRVEFVQLSEQEGDAIAKHVLKQQQEVLAIRQAKEAR